MNTCEAVSVMCAANQLGGITRWISTFADTFAEDKASG